MRSHRPRHKRPARRPRRIVTFGWCIVAGIACLTVPAALAIGAEVRDWVEPEPTPPAEGVIVLDRTEVQRP